MLAHRLSCVSRRDGVSLANRLAADCDYIDKTLLHQDAVNPNEVKDLARRATRP
jgi:hypothetical protein